MTTSVTGKDSFGSTIYVKPPVTAYYDRLGRVMRTEKTGFNQLIKTDVGYDRLGRMVAQSNPYTGASASHWTVTAYDDLGRAKKVTAPNATVTETKYMGRTTKVTVTTTDSPAKIQSNTTLVDAKGKTVAVWNADCTPADVTAPAFPNPSTASIRFELDGFGRMRKTHLLGKTASETITVTADYDALGGQTSLNDPDKGLWTYTNDALGRVTYQKDAKLSETFTTYDRLNRVLSRETKEANNGPIERAYWYYYETSVAGRPNTVLKGDQGWIGALQRTESQTTGLTGLYGDPGTKTVHYYDSRGNPFLDLTTIDGKWFYTQKSFDPANRLREVRHYWRPPEAESPTNLPYVWSDFGYSYTYDSNSYLTQLSDLTGNVWWKAVGNGAYDEQDRPVVVQKGSAYGTKRDYRVSDGVLERITTGRLSGNTPGAEIQNLSFGWDGLGNLTWRQSGSLREDFGYDELNRLTSSTLTGAINYFVDGGIKNKKDVNGATTDDYTYDPVHPHAVRTAFGYTMTYDANGNLNTRVSPTKTETWKTIWAGFDKPRILSKTTTTPAASSGSEFYYNANRSRVIHLDYDAADANGRSTRYTLKRLYAYGATMEVDYQNGNRELGSPAWKLDRVRIYVPGPEGTIGAMEYNAGSPSAAEKLVYHYDHLGSIESVTAFGDTNATVVPDKEGRPSKYSYDAWGQRRDGIDWSKSPTKTATGGATDVTPRGYTGHEMLDNLGLVHMNGRIYDPLVGRFLSADVVVQAPGNMQSYSRYSYVFNNPLTLTDPSGFIAGVDDAAIGAYFMTAAAVAYVSSPQGQQQIKETGEAIQRGLSSARQTLQQAEEKAKVAVLIVLAKAVYGAKGADEHRTDSSAISNPIAGDKGKIDNTQTNIEASEEKPLTSTSSPAPEVPKPEEGFTPSSDVAITQTETPPADPGDLPITTGGDPEQVVLPTSTEMTREERWQQLAGQGVLSKQETNHINKTGGTGMQAIFGKELAHLPKQSAAQGNDFSNAVPRTSADHRGIEHRYLKERRTGTTISRPKNCVRTGGKLDLPPEGCLP